MVVEDDLYLGARERRGEIEKEREERERGGHEQSRTFITLGTNFLTLETCSLTSHPGIYIEHSCSSDVTIDENRLYSDCNNSSTSPKFHTDTKRVRFHIRGLIPGHNATVLRLYSDDKESF